MRQLDTRGILEPDTGLAHFRLARHEPAPDLAAFVETHWTVAWSLREPFTQEILPYPNVNMVVEPGLAAVHGVPGGRFSRTLTGRGQAFGVKFRSGGFRPFVDFDVVELTGEVRSIETVFGADGAALTRAIEEAEDEHAAIARYEAFLRERLPAPDPKVALIDAIAAAILADPGLTRVDDLAARHAMSVRSLQRLFRGYVGVTPKWLLKRYRLHEAADRMAAGQVEDWAELALELGYADQAHFINDFRAVVGRPPGDYAAAMARPDGRPARTAPQPA
jgi:AraC-like DNA-binding protein